MELAQSFGMEQRDFRGERARAHPASLFKLQKISAIAQDGAVLETLKNAFFLRHKCSFSICTSSFQFTVLGSQFFGYCSRRGLFQSSFLPVTQHLVRCVVSGSACDPA